MSVLQPLTVGVEEEFHVVDPATRRLANDGGAILARLGSGDGRLFEEELKQTMVETATSVCANLAEVRAELVALRTDVAHAAAAVGRVVAAAGTLPTADWHSAAATHTDRYERIIDLAGIVGDELVVCGCHIHIGFADRGMALEVMNRARRWLPVLLALSTSSPFWSGADTGYDSYRTVLWGRLPTAHLPGAFATCEDYDALVAALVASGTILDEGQIYWDMRLSAHHPTLEFRVADVCTRVDDAVLLAGLCRAIAATCRQEVVDGVHQAPLRPELLRGAKWRAARFGLSHRLVDLGGDLSLAPAATVVTRMLEHLRPALEADGDWDEVRRLAQRTLDDGTGAQRQRAAMATSGSAEAVVDRIVEETGAG